MSFRFDGESRLYFLSVDRTDSRKAELTAKADVVRFPVCRAETPFVWRSVLLAGPIGEVSEADRDAVVEATDLRCRPDALERASASENSTLYAMWGSGAASSRSASPPCSWKSSRTGARCDRKTVN